MPKLDIMKSLDAFVFKKLEVLQANKEFQKIMDSYSNLDEKPQELVKAFMALALVLAPAAVIALFFGMNSSLMGELESKKELLEVSQKIIQEKSGIQGAQRRFLGTTFISSMNDMQSLVSRAIGMAGIDPSKISVSNFNAVEQEGFITQATIDMKFTGLSSSEMFSLISALSERQKARFDEISVKKNAGNNLLDGIATLLYLSKENQGGL